MQDSRPFFMTYGQTIALISNPTYWVKHEKDLNTWLEQNSSERHGMVIYFPNPETLTAFLLRWN